MMDKFLTVIKANEKRVANGGVDRISAREANYGGLRDPNRHETPSGSEPPTKRKKHSLSAKSKAASSYERPSDSIDESYLPAPSQGIDNNGDGDDNALETDPLDATDVAALETDTLDATNVTAPSKPSPSHEETSIFGRAGDENKTNHDSQSDPSTTDELQRIERSPRNDGNHSTSSGRAGAANNRDSHLDLFTAAEPERSESPKTLMWANKTMPVYDVNHSKRQSGKR
jgi:hypothetical protein